jgi:Ca-activated chloride channel family protein
MSLSRLGVAFVLLSLAGCQASAPVGPEVVRHSAPSVAAPSVTAAAPTLPAPAAPVPRDQLSVEVTSGLTVLPAGEAKEMFVRVRVKGLPLPASKRPRLDLALAVDTSGSMEGKGIEQVRAACKTLVDKLEEGDTVTIVTFGSKPKRVLEPITISKDTREATHKAIASMVADGTTDMGGALQVAVSHLVQKRSPERLQRVVLVGDGVPNDPAVVRAVADQAGAQKLPITVLGLGAEFDETLMASVAQRSRGTFHFVDDASRVAKVFDDELTKLGRVVARATFVELIPGPGVTLHEAVGLHHSAQGRNLRVDLGDLSEGQTRDVMIRATVGARPAGVKVEIVDATAHYQHGLTPVQLTAREFEALPSSADKAQLGDAVVVEVERQGIRLQVADQIVDAIALARAGDVKGARTLLDKTAKLAKSAAERFSDPDLSARAKEALDLKKSVASLAPPPATLGGLGGMGLGLGAGKAKMAMPAAPVSHDAALQIRGAHGRAMGEIQGL